MSMMPKLGKQLGTIVKGVLTPMTDAEYDAAYGPAVLDGVPLRTSVSSLQTLDPNTYGGCHRKWWYDKIGGKREPETKALTIGKRELHEPIEAYYKTGEEKFSPLVLQGKQLIYPHTEQLYIEREIAVPLDRPMPAAGEPIDLSLAPLRVDGIPLVGRVDLTHFLGWYLDSNGDRHTDPPNTAEVNDWKSTARREYAKKGAQLMTETIQMPGYGKWLTLQRPELEHVRLSHSYFNKDPKDRTAWKATVLVTREQLDRRWEYVDGLGRVMRDVARERTVDAVEGNRKSCDSYGRKGCPHKPSNGGTCTFGEFNSLSRIFGDRGASRILTNAANEQTTAPDEELIPVMGLLKNTNAAATATAQTGLKLPGNVAPQNTPAHVGVNVSLPTEPAANAAVDMLAMLAAEQAPATAPTVTLTPEVVAAFEVIDQAKLGRPNLGGAAADAFAAYSKTAHAPGAVIAGEGRLLGLNQHDTIDQLLALAGNLRQVLAKQAAAQTPPAATTPAPQASATMPPVPSIVSPETPASDPKLAASPVEGTTAPATVPATAVVGATGMSTPGTMAETPKAEPASDVKTDEPAPAKRKPGRPRKEKPAEAEGKSDESEQPFELYVDCVPSQPYELADQYISMLNVTLCKLCKVTEIPDIRSVGAKGHDALSYNSWRGTYEALVREAAADGHIPRCRLVVFTKGNELADLFVNGMIAARAKNEESGVYDGALILDSYVRGV